MLEYTPGDMTTDPGDKQLWISQHAYPFRLKMANLPDGRQRIKMRDNHLVREAGIWCGFGMALTLFSLWGLIAVDTGAIGVLGIVVGLLLAAFMFGWAVYECKQRALVYDPVKGKITFERTGMWRTPIRKEYDVSELVVMLRPVRLEITRWSGFVVVAVAGGEEWLALCCVRTREEVERFFEHDWPDWIRERYIGEGPPLIAHGSSRIWFGYG